MHGKMEKWATLNPGGECRRAPESPPSKMAFLHSVPAGPAGCIVKENIRRREKPLNSLQSRRTGLLKGLINPASALH